MPALPWPNVRMIMQPDPDVLCRIADALERLAPAPPPAPDFSSADAFMWENSGLRPIRKVARVELDLLHGINRVRDILVENTVRFARGLPANNALLWGARGMGKSSLVKAIHARVNLDPSCQLKLIEIHREEIETLPRLLAALAADRWRCLIFCDDLSFDAGETSYKSLKAVLEGGLEGRPDNVLFYATSNRRHLMSRQMIENERQTALIPSEAVEEKVSLSDRFGLWLGFHPCSQDDYLAMVRGYVAKLAVAIDPDELSHQALEWATARGSRSGRVAMQFVQDLAGRAGVTLDQL